jgi:hypothetical protein
MKLSYLALSLVAVGICSTAQAQIGASRPTTQPQKATTGVKQMPVKAAPMKGVNTPGSHVQPSQQGTTSLLVGGGDNCAVPDLIAGPGPFAVNNTAATTGAEGQAEGICLFFGQMGITSDVWFNWTSGVTGPVTLSMCAFTTGIDPKVAIYNGVGCPVSGTAIACNDDFCGLVSQVSWNAISGNSYVVQMGNFPGALTYTSSFTIQAPPPGPPNDNCSGATPISGLGVFPVDTTGATGSIANGFCAQPNNDVWFAWTATATGPVEIGTCSLTGTDTVIAVWNSGVCPPTTMVVCNDDNCGLQTKVTFAATSGTTYLLEWGAFGTGTTYVASFFIQNPPPPPSNDDCSTPIAITPGAGPYPFDNTAGLTGAQGQSEPLCLFFGSTTIDHDLWYTWGPAPATSPFRLFTCGFTAVDTKAAIYDNAGCPGAGAIACNDDDCGLQTGVVFNAIGGNTYTVQLGTFPGALGGAGSFDIVPFVPPAGDDCTVPTILVGPGPYAYDNTAATTGAQGQSEPLCLFFGSTTIDDDLWFCWTAPASGSFDVTTLGFTFVDTKLAVYDGCGCPVSPALACNDDSCGTLQSTATFNAVNGNSYTIQLGNFPGASGGPGAFDIIPTPSSGGPACQYDDGTSENSIGLTAGGQFLWIQPFGSVGGQTLVSSVSTSYGTPLFPGGTPPVGTPVDVCVYDDPNDDGDPSDGVLISQTPGVVGNVDNDVLDTYAVPPAVLNGVFFVGVAINHTSGQFPAPLDGNFCGAAQAWGVGNTTGPGTLNFTTLTANNVPPTNITAIFGGIWMVRAGCSTSAGTSFCGNGDPNRIPCPCGNNGTDPAAGCANSLNPAGAVLTTTGFTQTDDVVLHATGMSGAITIFFRTLGPQVPTGVVFGDGVTCTGGSLLRLRAVNFPVGIGNTASFPVPPETITLSARSGTFPGSGATMQYGNFYRNAAAVFCPPFTFNTGNTIEMTW